MQPREFSGVSAACSCRSQPQQTKFQINHCINQEIYQILFLIISCLIEFEIFSFSICILCCSYDCSWLWAVQLFPNHSIILSVGVSLIYLQVQGMVLFLTFFSLFVSPSRIITSGPMAEVDSYNVCREGGGWRKQTFIIHKCFYFIHFLIWTLGLRLSETIFLIFFGIWEMLKLVLLPLRLRLFIPG